MEVYSKAHTWIAPDIFIEGECDGVYPYTETLQGSFAKEGKATTYVYYYCGEEGGYFTVAKAKKAKKEFRGPLYFFGGEDGEAVVTT